MRSKVMKMTVLTILSLFALLANTSELEIPNKFEDGQVTSASEMNANFEAIKAAVNDNHNRTGTGAGTGQSKRQFVGVSELKLNGAAGIFVMQKACYVFSPNSSVCDTTEVARSQYNAQTMEAAHDPAWLFIDVQSAYGGISIDKSGLKFLSSSSCEGWSSASNSIRGATVSSKDQIDSYVSMCNVERPVACCK